MAQVVITGGSGLLGRALLARLADTHDLTVISRSEKLQLPLRAQYPRVRFLLGDVCDRSLLARACVGAALVIHAAALKHVPLSERQPTEYARVNVDGSRAVVEIAQMVGARVIGISTDKACAPRNVYGLTKLLTERICVEHDQVAVRYGNVFGSDGSVIPQWRAEWAATRTVTVTDPEMTRFFFRIEAAVDLITWAWQTAPPGTVVVPRLRAVRLGDLADAFLAHVGGGSVRVIGPRPGEKAHETLIAPEECPQAVAAGKYVLLQRDAVSTPMVPPLTSDTAERIPVEELVTWLT